MKDKVDLTRVVVAFVPDARVTATDLGTYEATGNWLDLVCDSGIGAPPMVNTGDLAKCVEEAGCFSMLCARADMESMLPAFLARVRMTVMAGNNGFLAERARELAEMATAPSGRLVQ